MEVLEKMDVVSPTAYEDWRRGRVLYLEKVTACGMGKLNTILKTLRLIAAEQGLKPSLTVYNKWGKGKKTRLRFSKTGSPYMEEMYATHYYHLEAKCPDVKNCSVRPGTGLCNS